MEKQYVYIKKKHLEPADIQSIRELERTCLAYESLGLKLELDFKSTSAMIKSGTSDLGFNEFLCYDGEILIAYVGINKFNEQPAEVNGMVHPKWRNLGIFTALFAMAIEELKSRGETKLLALCDAKTSFSEILIRNYAGKVAHTEYEMFLTENNDNLIIESEIGLVKATKADALEIKKMNRIFSGAEDSSDIDPEESDRFGLEIYLIKRANTNIGKIHLQTGQKNGGIYGFFIYPEFRGFGYGKAALALAIKYLKKQDIPKIHLQVDSTNTLAYHLYLTSGFLIETAMDYYLISI